MILALDVHYRQDHARTVGLTFKHWEDAMAYRIYTDRSDQVADYEPGAFYKRELPCLLALLKQIELPEIEAIVVDGYVHLGEGHPGLGAHLFESLHRQVPVIGVAKTFYKNAENFALPLLRGASLVPLWITAAGMLPSEALDHIASMGGVHRMPTLLRQLDTISKEEP